MVILITRIASDNMINNGNNSTNNSPTSNKKGRSVNQPTTINAAPVENTTKENVGIRKEANPKLKMK